MPPPAPAAAPTADRPDPPDRPRYSLMRSPFVIPVFIAAAAVPACALLVLLALDPPFVLGALRVALVLLITGLAGALALGLLWLYRRAQRAAIVTLQHGQPVHVADLRALTRATVAATLERHYAAIAGPSLDRATVAYASAGGAVVGAL